MTELAKSVLTETSPARFQDWLTAYNRLPPFSQSILQVMAIHYEPMRRKSLLKILKESGVQPDDGARLTQVLVNARLAELLQTGWVEQEGGYYTCTPKIVEELMRVAVRENTLNRWARAIRNYHPVSTESWHMHRFRSYGQGVREVRLALYEGNYRALEDNLTYLKLQYSDRLQANHPYGLILQNVQDRDWLHTIPQSIVLEGFHHRLSYSLAQLSPAFQLVQMLESYCQSLEQETPPELRLLLGEQLLFRGDFDALSALVDGLPHPNALGLLASLRLIQQKPNQAYELFQQALHEPSTDSSKPKQITFYSFLDVFYVLTLLSLGTTASQEEALQYLHKARRKAPSGLRDNYILLEKLIHFQRGQYNDPFLLVQEILEKTPWHSLTVWLQAWAVTWVDVGAAQTFRQNFRQQYEQAKASGYRWLQAEMASVLLAMGVEDAALKEFSQEFWKSTQCKSFVYLLQAKEPWERSLEALIQLRPQPKADSSDKDVAQERLIWLLQPAGKSVLIEPRLQKRSGKGKWSKGRKVGLQRLRHETHSLEFLTPQDIQICQHIVQKSRSYYHYGQPVFDWDEDNALLAMIGHPHVYWYNDRRRTPIELVQGEITLQVTQEKDHFHLQLHPPVHSDSRVAIVKESPTRLCVALIQEEHRRLKAVLGPEGVQAPRQAKDTVLEAIAAVAPWVTVHSDIGGGTDSIEEVEASTRLYVHLTPLGQGLKMQLWVQPFGPDGPAFRPGRGGESVFATLQHHQYHTRRPLEQERDQAEALVATCPTLARYPDNGWEWVLTELKDCLELLLELKALREQIELRWPEGETFKIRQQVSLQQLRVQLSGQGGWFEATGQLEVEPEMVLSLDALLSMSRDSMGRFLRLEDGQFIALTQTFRRYLDDLYTYTESRPEGQRFHASAALALEGLWENVGQLQGNKSWDTFQRRLRQPSTQDTPVPSTFQAELRDYQNEGYQWLMRMADWGFGACLADEMGLGKTLQALAVLLARAPQGPALVVAPTSVCFNWIEEARRFAPTLQMQLFGGRQRQEMLDSLGPFDVLVCSYGLLPSESDMLTAQSWHTIVLDEAQAIKNAATQRSQAAMKLQSPFKIITTGTPIENHLGELWNLFRFINPGLLGSWNQFQEKFAQPIEKDNDRDTRQRLKRLVQPFILRRRKQDVLDELPPRTDIVLHVSLSKAEQALYESLRQKALQDLAQLDSAAGQPHFQILAELMRLRRACCHPRLVLPESPLHSSKLAVFGEVMEELVANRHKVLVFSQFVGYLEIIRDYLDGQGITYQYLDGSTPQRERQKRIEAFQAGEGEAFLLSLKAGGFGINLTAADYVIHMDPWWNPAVEDQASDRAHRIGQQRPVTVYRLVTSGTVEEKIVELHHHKRDLAESLLEGSDMTGKITAEELLQLIQSG